MLPHSTSSEQFVAAIEAWLQLFATGRAQEACALLDEPSSYGQRWSPESVNAVVLNTFGPDAPRITAPPGPPVRVTIIENAGGDILVDYPVPLNGNWSDLTAQFEFRRRDSGWAMALEDLHVL